MHKENSFEIFYKYPIQSTFTFQLLIEQTNVFYCKIIMSHYTIDSINIVNENPSI